MTYDEQFEKMLADAQEALDNNPNNIPGEETK